MSEDQAPYVTGYDPNAITPEKLERAGWTSGTLWSLADFPPMWVKRAWWYENDQGEVLSYCEVWAMQDDSQVYPIYIRLFDGDDEAISRLPIHTMTDLLTLYRLLSGEGLNNE